MNIPNFGTDMEKVKRIMVPSPADYILKSWMPFYVYKPIFYLWYQKDINHDHYFRYIFDLYPF